jgi:hypothetical protein
MSLAERRETARSGMQTDFSQAGVIMRLSALGLVAARMISHKG